MSSQRTRILIVDDMPVNRDLLSRRIVQQGHEVAEAKDGREAVEMLSRQPFDLLLLDIMMPEMNGYQVLERMKADEHLRHIPVIVISALNELDSVVRCVELGAEDYLLKPFNAVLLKARVGACLEKKGLRDREQEALAQLGAEREKSERLLLSILPPAIAERLKRSPGTIADSFEEATILFANISGFSLLSAIKRPAELVELLNVVFCAFDDLCEKHGVEKIKSMGDTYIAAGGVPQPRPNHAEAVADLALAMQREIVRVSAGLPEPLSLRVGIDTGPVIAGVIGNKKLAYDLWGSTMTRASQMETLGVAGGLQVTAATYERLKQNYMFESRGSFYINGEGEIETYLLKGRRAAR